jgi:hypothetical protein
MIDSMKLERLKWRGIRVYEYVYEYGKNSGEYTLPTYPYTYSYTRISSYVSVQDLAKKLRESVSSRPRLSLSVSSVFSVLRFLFFQTLQCQGLSGG